MFRKKVRKKLNAKDLIEKIQHLVRKRMSSEAIVSLKNLKKTKTPDEPPTLLIVEDDEAIRKALIRIFESEGYKILAAGDVTELNEVLDQKIIDLIILDVGLPWMSGFELAEMFKAHPEIKKIPIVFMSGHSQVEMIRKGFSVGAHDYITKPFEIETVKKTVRTLLELS